MRSVLLYELLLWWLCLFGCVLASGHYDFYGRRYDHYHGKYSDSELMVDVINNFGLRLLMAHNEHNENNIAFSPYGIGVILMALGEGLRGEALYEIRKAIYLPYDAHTIRVGLRDIHRHLKSYFIPKEGFLAGITLNSENVSINPQYIQLLKFYGYDINSFNTALYPESHITTTESGLMDGKEETTTTNEVTLSSTVYPTTTTDNNKSDEANMSENPSVVITSTSQSISETTEPISTTAAPTTTIENQSTTLQTTLTVALTETTSEVLNTEIVVVSTTEEGETVTTETATTMISTQANSDTNNNAETITSVSLGTDSSTTEDVQTTTFSVTISLPTSSEAIETTEVTTTDPPETTTEEESSENGSVTEGTITTETVQLTSLPYSPEETTQLYTSVTTTTLSDTDVSELTTSTTTTSDNTETSTIVRNARSSEEISYINKVEDEFNDEFLGNEPGEEPILVANKTKADTTKGIRKFGSNDWSIQINNQIELLNAEEPSSSEISVRPIINDEKRKPRSIEEYVITRFYHYPNFRPTNHYEPDEALYFFVNEKNKEAGLEFMTYDTVLPFLFIPNPSAMALAFPLDSDKYYLLLMLPSDTNRLDDLICKLYVHNTFKYVLNNLELTHVKVNIPSFSLGGRITLTNSLQKLGIRRIFEPRQADFSPMTPAEGVYVTNIEQAVSIAIKNNLNIKRDTRHGHHYYSEPIRFNVNRPFLYFVIDSELQIILMTGKIVNPLNVRIK